MIDDTDVTTLRSQWQSYLTSAAGKSTGDKGVCYLPELALLRFTGGDTLTFLQGYLTSDVFELREDHLSPTALCNLKGRVVANGWCTKLVGLVNQDGQGKIPDLRAVVDALAVDNPYAIFADAPVGEQRLQEF